MNQDVANIIILLLLVAAFFFLIIRPARARQRQAAETQRALQGGQDVMTTAGLFARVSSVEDDVVVLEIAPGVEARFARQAVARIVTPTPDGGGSPKDGDAADSQ
ncbi:MAG: preprotein translocase subunit YajC [Carbonactinosporaceae bacterium]